jgi:hypothetical protein
MHKFVCIRWLGFRLIRRLAQRGAGLVELLNACAVVEPIDIGLRGHVFTFHTYNLHCPQEFAR